MTGKQVTKAAVRVASKIHKLQEISTKLKQLSPTDKKYAATVTKYAEKIDEGLGEVLVLADTVVVGAGEKS